ncbi:uncharacterized protein LOC105846147 isoform X2 [Hydra vulgaris]|uniref:uncharacterized protein LOC105846147 isoform X2 n=1 Tax=Hydra vulgaris TaxID=6087 RepID=UPI001F5F7F41|nr:uncharacterized protein LOC105846147 isoform X2 [Hydra vulgaris]
MSSYSSTASAKKIPKLDVLNVCIALKTFYKKTYEKIGEHQPPLTTNTNVNILNKFVDLHIVDAVNVRKDIIIADREYYWIAGIGKTWLLRKLLLDWSNGTILNNFDLVFYLDGKMLNNCHNISNINDLLRHFYKDILLDFDVFKQSTIFIVDDLDEYQYFDNIIKCQFSLMLNSARKLCDLLTTILNNKVIVAGRLNAIWNYENIVADKTSKLIIQVMGFNQNAIDYYIEKNVNNEVKENVKRVLKESLIAKEMAFVPFYLSSICKYFELKNSSNSIFSTMTSLYTNIFFYFWQKHINKSNEPVYKILQNWKTEKKIYYLSKLAYYFFINNKIVFSGKEFFGYMGNFDHKNDLTNDFIECIETNLGYRYRFVNVAFLDFCASVYVYNNLNSEEIKSNKKLYNLYPIICGLLNRNEESFIPLLADTNLSESRFKPESDYYEETSETSPTKIQTPLMYILDLFPTFPYGLKKIFMTCFYESQATITDDIKESIDKSLCQIWILNKTFYEVSCQFYFVEQLINSGKKLDYLIVGKSKHNKANLTKLEEKLIMKCSTNVVNVTLRIPLKIEFWKPMNKIESLFIDCFLTLISKEEYENFLPWFNLCEKLFIHLHEDTNFLNDIYEWVSLLNLKRLVISYRNHVFRNLKSFKDFLNNAKKISS